MPSLLYTFSTTNKKGVQYGRKHERKGMASPYER